MEGDVGRQESVLTAAVLEVAETLELSENSLAAVLQVSPPDVARMQSGEARLQGGNPGWEGGLRLVRLFQALYAVFGGDKRAMRAWMVNANQGLGGVPEKMIRTPAGLAEVLGYAEDHLAK
jgi:hypothetical protein